MAMRTMRMTQSNQAPRVPGLKSCLPKVRSCCVRDHRVTGESISHCLFAKTFSQRFRLRRSDTSTFAFWKRVLPLQVSLRCCGSFDPKRNFGEPWLNLEPFLLLVCHWPLGSPQLAATSLLTVLFRRGARLLPVPGRSQQSH